MTTTVLLRLDATLAWWVLGADGAGRAEVMKPGFTSLNGAYVFWLGEAAVAFTVIVVFAVFVEL